ncbi:MAG: nucleotidyltransferase domain-containing protein, partial [bacterium]|nr:nucleotidyltransferase domain-containing protein [bacterium]
MDIRELSPITYKEKLMLKEISRKYRLSLVILFGSQVGGTIREGSDVDIAIYYYPATFALSARMLRL